MKITASRTAIIVALLIAPAWIVVHTGHASDCREADKTVSFQHDVLPILQSKCMACHFDSEPPLHLNLSSPTAYASLVGRTSIEMSDEDLVKPGDLAHSYLINKISAKPSVGDPMPAYGAPLTPSERKLLTQWVAQGAKNN